MDISDLKLYNNYKLDDLKDAFKNGAFQFGQGMVYTRSTNTLVLISKHTKDRIYGDELKDKKIYYTGMGQNGDQQVALGNKRLVDAKKDNTTVYIFLVYKQNEYKFYGRVELNDPYYYELEPDQKGNMRKVLKFPLTFVDALAPVSQSDMAKMLVGGNAKTQRVVGACISDGSKYLMSQRSKKQGYEGKWEFPGGKVEENENDIDAIKREIKEEIGVEIEVSDLLETNSFYEKEKNRIIQLNVYNALIKDGVPKAKEGQVLEWKSLDEIENLDLMPADVNIVQTLIDKAPRKIVGTIDFVYKEGKKKTSKPSDVKRECQDYEKSQKRKAKAGEEAEMAVMSYEANKLREAGRIDFINQIQQVSKLSSDYGYDIKSFDVVNGDVQEIHIEVKSATLVGGNVEFFISQAEYRNCVDDKAYKIYALIRFGKDYKLHIIKRDLFIADENYLHAVSYKVSIPVNLISNS